MQRSMRALAAETTSSHNLGIQQSKAHAIALRDLQRSFVDVGYRVRGVFTPANGGLSSQQLAREGHRLCRSFYVRCWQMQTFQLGHFGSE
jgi:hypothetical protein